MSIWLQGLSDILINLSAGWFGAAFILPMTIRKFKVNWRILTINIACGIFTYVTAMIIRIFV